MKTTKQKYILRCFLILFAACFLTILVVSRARTQSGLKAIPSNSKKGTATDQHAMATAQNNSRPMDQYNRILVLYLRNVDSIVRQQRQQASALYSQSLSDRKKRIEDLNSHEAANQTMLENASSHRQSKQLDFDGEVPETASALLDSSASGRIFTALCREKKVNELMLVATARYSSLLPSSPTMTPEWIALVKNIDQGHPNDLILHRIVTKLLYAAGVDTKELRPALIQLVTKSSDNDALHLLFFMYDHNTGEKLPRITPENLAMLKYLVKSQSLAPEEQEECAEYAAAIYNYDIAQSVCISLLQQRYKGFDNPLNKDRVSADDASGRARERAMKLMFYRIHSERVFRAIYDLSAFVQMRTQKIPTDEKFIPRNIDALGSERIDIDSAKSYIGEVSSWEGR